MEICLMAAILGVAFLILYFIRDLQTEHIALRLFGIFMFLALITIAGKAAIDPNCHLVLNNTQEIFIYGNNYTGYHWEYDDSPPPPGINETNLFHRNTTYYYHTACEERPNNTDVIFYKTLLIFDYIVIAYIFIYFLRKVLEWKGIIKPKKN